jgi:hypothetical protein
MPLRNNMQKLLYFLLYQISKMMHPSTLDHISDLILNQIWKIMRMHVKIHIQDPNGHNPPYIATGDLVGDPVDPEEDEIPI